MAANTQFSIAVHLLAGLASSCEKDVTSAQLAGSVNTSPSFVRRIMAKLSKAGLVRTATGQGGACWLARDAAKITLLDVYRAVDAPHAFTIHDYAPQKQCAVSCNIKRALEHALDKTQASMEAALKKINLADVLADMKGPAAPPE